MEQAEQTRMQHYIRTFRAERLITAAQMDVIEALIWKCRKRTDGTFQASYKQLAGMARCCRDTAIEAIKRAVSLGILHVDNATRVWVPRLLRWVQARNIYRLVMPRPPALEPRRAADAPPSSESEKPTPYSGAKNLPLLSSRLVPRTAARIAWERRGGSTATLPPSRSPLLEALASLGRAIGGGRLGESGTS